MSHSKPSRRRKQTQGRKATRPLPHPDFPLFHHASGRWAKKVRGKLCYFGKVSNDPDGSKAWDFWNEHKSDLLRGRKPQRAPGVKLHDVVNGFLTDKQRKVESGELSPRTFARYKATGEMLAAHFGRDLPVADFTPADDDAEAQQFVVKQFGALRAAMAKRFGPVALGNEIQIVRSIFLYGKKAKLHREVEFGPEFDKPSKKTLRKASAEGGPKLFTAEQIHALRAAASPRMATMIILGINGGLGNTDVARLPIDAIDLLGGWLNYPRPKTGIPRRIPLWPETVAAIRAVLDARPTPIDLELAGLLFIRDDGTAYVDRNNPLIDKVTREFRTLLTRAKVDGRSFYDLRRTFETIGGASRDQVAVDSIMAHAPDSGDMAAIYRQSVGDDRLLAVVNHVRAWLWPELPAKDATKPAKRKRTARPRAARSKPITAKGPRAEVGEFQFRIVG